PGVLASDMWSTVKTPAIVLTSYPWREADRRYTALTPLDGKLEFQGRGAQKPRAKLASHLEPFAVVELEIIRGARSTTVISAERGEAFRNIGEVLEHRLLAQSLLALVDHAVKPDLADEVLYLDVLEALRFLNTQPALPSGRNALFLGGFLLRFLKRLGYDIELRHCLSCRDAIVPLCFRWDGGRGGLVCSDCVGKRPTDWLQARSLEEEVVMLMRFARDAEYAELLRPRLRGDYVQAFTTCVEDVVTYHIPGSGAAPFCGVFLPELAKT
ncbi:MAG: DNA repair protein RecO, partial [Candidatus Uhrbacteria bacterium]|nr:DNA repair protein RecO [Candidatus Uhrbacteria bacterium]